MALIAFKGGFAAKVPVMGTEYHFSPDRYGRFVAEVHDQRHIPIFTACEDRYAIVDQVADPPEPAVAKPRAGRPPKPAPVAPAAPVLDDGDDDDAPLSPETEAAFGLPQAFVPGSEAPAAPVIETQDQPGATAQDPAPVATPSSAPRVPSRSRKPK